MNTVNLNEKQSKYFIDLLLETPTKIGLPLLQFLENAHKENNTETATDGIKNND
jgi:hypothetical protein